MATREAELINAVCRTKDISTLLADNVDELLGPYQNVWDDAKRYYQRHHAVPPIEVLVEKYDDLEVVETKAEASHYLDSLREEYLTNELQKVATQLAQRIGTDSGPRLLERFQNRLTKLSKYTNSVRDLDLTDFEEAAHHFENVKQRAERMGGSPGIPTGISFIDSAYTTGQAPGHLIVTIGWPGKKKTWFSSYLACNAFAQGWKPMIVSLEMTPENMRDRIYTIMGSGLFSASGFARGDVDTEEFRKWANEYFSNKNGFILVSNDGMNEVTPNAIQAKIEQHRPDMVIVDYAQLMSDNRKTDGMTPRMMNLSKELKSMAVTNQIPVNMITAATSEETSDRNDPPTLSKVAWSKSIEYDADMAFAVHGNDDNNLIDIIGRKNRHGVLFGGMLEWDIDRGIIEEKF